jgi:hypothetical protein
MYVRFLATNHFKAGLNYNKSGNVLFSGLWTDYPQVFALILN